MRWEDERYIRFYTRNTPEWCALSWQARGLLGLIFREVDRAGLLQLGKLGLKGVAVAVRAPWVEIEAPLQELLADGCVELSGDGTILIVPNFIEAQEAIQSDVARKRKSRETARAKVTARDRIESQAVTSKMSRVVTDGHAESRDVTRGHSDPCLSDPIRAVPNRALSEETPGIGSASPVSPPDPIQAPLQLETQKPKAKKPPDPARADAVQVVEVFNAGWTATRRPADGKPPKCDKAGFQQVLTLVRAHGLSEAQRLVQRYLDDPDDWLTRQGHPLRLLSTRVDAYRATTGPPPKARDRPGFIEPRPPVAESKEVKL